MFTEKQRLQLAIRYHMDQIEREAFDGKSIFSEKCRKYFTRNITSAMTGPQVRDAALAALNQRMPEEVRYIVIPYHPLPYMRGKYFRAHTYILGRHGTMYPTLNILSAMLDRRKLSPSSTTLFEMVDTPYFSLDYEIIDTILQRWLQIHYPNLGRAVLTCLSDDEAKIAIVESCARMSGYPNIAEMIRDA